MHCPSGHSFNDGLDESIEECPECGTSNIHYGFGDGCYECTELQREEIREENYNIPPKPYEPTIKLNHFYELSEMKGEWLNWMNNSCMVEHFLPTACVVYEPGIVVPRISRSFPTNLAVRNDKLYEFVELQTHDRDFQGTSHENCVEMYEVWENHGNDGHVDYRLTGFVFVDNKTYEKTTKKINKQYVGLSMHKTKIHQMVLSSLSEEEE